MNTFSIYVVYTAKEGLRKAFLEAIHKEDIPAKVRAEDGCIRYDYFLPLDAENDILLIEEWESEEKQQIHVAQPHMARLRELKDPYIASTRLGKFEFLD
ncbi:MAG: antibiotic biosynthesis monooxygenase [Clostridia bacterium]|nr:antibiotic biosynthesis monooxygenase [Clostridia bacterium]